MENGLKPKMRFAWLGSLSSTSVECFCYLYRSTISLFSFSLLCKKCDCFFHQLILHTWLQTSGMKALHDALKADAKSYRRKVNLNLRDVKEEESSNCNLLNRNLVISTQKQILIFHTDKWLTDHAGSINRMVSESLQLQCKLSLSFAKSGEVIFA